MVKVSYNQKPYRRLMMQTWGADVFASPSDIDQDRPRHPRRRPGQPGQPGHRDFRGDRSRPNPGTKYALGSVLNHVLLHQTVIGLEAKKQFEKIGEYPT
jgi:tryptophan synthase beta chain